MDTKLPQPAAVQALEVPRLPAETPIPKPESSPATPATPTNTTATPGPGPGPGPASTSTPDPAPTVASVDGKDTPATSTTRPTETPSTDAEVIYIPSYSRWFSWKGIHECEIRFLPEFFDDRSPSKNPRVYKYYRNSIIRRFRENPTRKITFTEVRKTIIGDVGSVRRVFDFLEAWGLVNYSPGPASKVALKWEDKENKSSATSSQSNIEPAGNSTDYIAPKKRFCSGCKSVCSIACFACDKYDLTLCARCYVRGNYRVGVNSSDFRRVEINEEIKADWTDKETLQLMEAILHYGDDWKKVAAHVGGRSERECVYRFIKLPFAEQFEGPPDSSEVVDKFKQNRDQNDADFGVKNSGMSIPSKKMRLSPLADASNPIMAQAAFLSALGGVEVSEVAACAAVGALSELSHRTNKENLESLSGHTRQQEPDATSNGGTTLRTLEGADAEVQSQLEEEQRELERAITYICDVQMKEIQEKISHFEEVESQVEKEWQQLQQMKNLLFADQLTLLFNKSDAQKTRENKQQNFKTE